MELEAIIRIPAAGATMAIPTREPVFRPGVAGPQIVDSSHVADVGGLRTVELEDGLLRIELKSGEGYQFPLAELLEEGAESDPAAARIDARG